MSFAEALAQQPLWLQLWFNILGLGAFVLPVALLIWRETRVLGGLVIAASVMAGLSITWLYGQLGYVRILGVPHIILWGPLVIYMLRRLRGSDIRVWPRRIMWGIVVILCVSLAFDVSDAIRWLLGERDATFMPA